jgi:hypothetical protein
MAPIGNVKEYPTAMLATSRCDRCGGQAYVEVALTGGTSLLFCSHHATAHWDKLVSMHARISDHRLFLRAQESRVAAG